MKKIQRLKTASQTMITAIIAVFVVAGLAGATTIGINISTDGSLTVVGTTTLSSMLDIDVSGGGQPINVNDSSFVISSSGSIYSSAGMNLDGDYSLSASGVLGSDSADLLQIPAEVQFGPLLSPHTTIDDSGISVSGSLTVTGTATIDGGTFFVDAVNDRVGIGTTTPQSSLNIVDGDLFFDAEVEDLSELIRFRSHNSDHVVMGYQNDFSGLNIGVDTGMSILLDKNNDDPVSIFMIGMNATSSADATELFRVQQDGNVGIGVSNPDAKLDVDGEIITKGPFVDVRKYASFASAIATIGSDKKTLLIPTVQSVTANITVPDNITLYFLNDGQLSLASNVHVSINGLIRASYGQIFVFADSLSVVYYSGEIERPVEWFGATGDGSTNDYDSFLNALKSLSVAGKGGVVTIDTRKVYILNNGSDPAIDLNAALWPDGTSASFEDEIPLMGIRGRGSVRPKTQYGMAAPIPLGYLKITGTGDGIRITTSDPNYKWRGNIVVENIALHGNGTASDGISINYANYHNKFKSILIYDFTGDGFVLNSDNTYYGVFEEIDSRYNNGRGFVIDGNAYDFIRCRAAFNDAGGVQFVVANNVNWIGGGIEFNGIPQVELNAVRGLNLQQIYFEGQNDAIDTPTSGIGEGLIHIDGEVTGLRLSGRFTYGTSNDSYKEQYILKFVSGSLYASNIGPILSTMADFGSTSVYGVGPVGASAIENSQYGPIWWSGATVSEDFADTETAEKFKYFNMNNTTHFPGDVLVTSGNVGIGTSTPDANLQVYGGDTSASVVEIGGVTSSEGACFKLRDGDGAGWTYCTTLNGTFSCSTTSCE